MFPAQEPGSRPRRPSIHQPFADAVVHRGSGKVTATLSVRGKPGASLAVYPDRYLPPAPTAFTVVKGSDQTYTWDTIATAGQYAFSVYGPDGFLTSFAGAIVPAGQNAGKVPTVAATLVTRPAAVVRLALGNDGQKVVAFTLTPNDFAGHQRIVLVTTGHAKTVDREFGAGGGADETGGVAGGSGAGLPDRDAGPGRTARRYALCAAQYGIRNAVSAASISSGASSRQWPATARHTGENPGRRRPGPWLRRGANRAQPASEMVLAGKTRSPDRRTSPCRRRINWDAGHPGARFLRLSMDR
jgi:hypothetical protein